MGVLSGFDFDEMFKQIDEKDKEVQDICKRYSARMNKYNESVDKLELEDDADTKTQRNFYGKKIYSLGRRVQSAKKISSQIVQCNNSLVGSFQGVEDKINRGGTKLALVTTKSTLEKSVNEYEQLVLPTDTKVELLTKGESDVVELRRLFLKCQNESPPEIFDDMVRSYIKSYGVAPQDDCKYAVHDIAKARDYCVEYNNLQKTLDAYLSKLDLLITKVFKEQPDKSDVSAEDIFSNGQPQYNGKKAVYQEETKPIEMKGKGAEVVTRGVMGNYYGRLEMTLVVLENIRDYCGNDLTFFQTFGFNNNGNILVNDKIYKINYTEGVNELPDIIKGDIANNNWSNVLSFSDKSAIRYFACIRYFTFATDEQFVEFARQLGVCTTSLKTTAHKIIKKYKKLMPSLIDFKIAGYRILSTETAEDRATEYNYRPSLFNEAYTSTRDKVANKIIEKQYSSGIKDKLRGDGVKGVAGKLWEKPIFRVATKVFGYGVGVPLGFTALGAVGAFATVCGALGIGVLGMLEYKNVKKLIQSN